MGGKEDCNVAYIPLLGMIQKHWRNGTQKA